MTTSESTTITWDKGDDGIVVLTLDDPARPVNTMNSAWIASMHVTVDRLEAEQEDIKGVVLTSAKRSFFAGGDLDHLRSFGRDETEGALAFVTEVKDLLRRLETLRVPVVAAINGAALGGGLELALACHRRIAVLDPGVVVGFPEVTFGLLPGGGGIIRTVRMLGLRTALSELLLDGRRHGARQAAELGLVDELVGTSEELIPAAKTWIASVDGQQLAQPWDVKGHRIPGGLPADLPSMSAGLSKRLKGANCPAPKHIMSAAVESAQVDFDTASAIEGRYFADLATGQVSKNMIQAFFFDLQQVNGDRGRPEGIERFTPKKVVVLGAGMMGAAIAYVSAKAGIEVILKDVDQAAADRGKDYSVKLVQKAVGRGRQSQQDGEALLARITPTTEAAAAAGADLVIEAVFEDPGVKQQVMAEIEPHLAPDALLGSNTSTLPITALADNVTRPADFIGLHFFSPVDKMPLLEIIKGQQTSDETLYRALDFSKLIKKTPIVVNDSRGFFTSRVIFTFLHEGAAMLAEGIPAATIEQASSQAGYPTPVLRLLDELNLELMQRIARAAADAGEPAGRVLADHPGRAAIDRMLELGRPGRLGGAGFYDYDGGRRSGLWPGLRGVFPVTGDPAAIKLKDMIERLLFAEALEAVRCLDEGVIDSVADANIGSILGIGYPGWTGGVLQYINGHEDRGRTGLPAFVTRARELADRYGERFAPPPSLVARAEMREPYRDLPAVLA